MHLITRTGGSQGVDRVMNCICLSCLFVHTLKGKWLELSTPKLVKIYLMAGPEVKRLGLGWEEA